MPDDFGMTCPICGSDSWSIVAQTSDFGLSQCINKCIIRTLPMPLYEPETDNTGNSETVTVMENVYSDPADGHFRLARELLCLAGRFKPGGRLLDIGCGMGHLLKLAQEIGYDITGIDPTNSSTKYAQQIFGLNPLIGFFPDERLGLETFDIITMNHVLEHLPDPNFVLNAAIHLLKDSGVLAIASPDYNGLMRRLRRTKWEGIRPCEHVWQLTSNSIANLLLKNGLEIAAKKNTTLQYNTSVGSLFRRLALKTAIGVAGPLNLGDNAIVIAQKSSSKRRPAA
ncbi:MAG: class I SAM-dependent methyltransferase [Armatimonadota bacterium]